MSTANLSAQSFRATADRTEVAVDGVFRVTFTFENVKANDFNPPNFSPFEAYGPSQTNNTSWVNGKVSRTSTYTYTLKPTKVGEFTIPAALARIDGEVEKTNPISIKVVATSSGGNANNNTGGNNSGTSQDDDIEQQIR